MIPWWGLIFAFIGGMVFAVVVLMIMTDEDNDTEDDDDTL